MDRDCNESLNQDVLSICFWGAPVQDRKSSLDTYVEIYMEERGYGTKVETRTAEKLQRSVIRSF